MTAHPLSKLSPSLCLVCLALLSPLAAADTITGRVVDAQGVGVAGVDLDVEDLINGGDPGLADGGTDANGFFSATLPAGFYRVTFTPPAPPATTHLVTEVDDLTVVGTVDLGVITLPAGVSLGGRVLNQGGLPVQGIDIDVIDVATGDVLNVPGDFTNAFGSFLIAVPSAPIDVQFETHNTTPLLAPIERRLNPSGNTDLGDLTLLPGFVVSGTVRDGSSAPLQGVDFDAIDTVTGEKAFTPGDNSDSSGNFSFVVSAGTWDFEGCPLPGSMLVAAAQTGVSISANTNVGTVTLQDGVRLFGTIRDGSGNPVRDADVDVFRSSNGNPITLCGDNTDALGNYSVIVPTGTLDIVFGRPQLPASDTDVHPGVVVAGDTRVDGVLGDCPCALLPFAGPIGTAGTVQRSRADGGKRFPRLHPGPGALHLTGGIPGGTAVLLFGPENDPLAATTSRRVLTLDGFGALRLPLPRPTREAVLFVRFAVLDRSAPGGFALSSGVRISPTP